MRWIAAVVFAGLAASATAQQGVDFSGRWRLKSPAAAAGSPRVIVVDQPMTQTSVRGERRAPIFSSISIRRVSASGVITMETRDIGLMGGSIGGPTGAVPRRTYTGTMWQGRRLLFSGGTYTGFEPRSGTWTEHREAWWIAPDGTLVIEIVTETSESARQVQELEYIRATGSRKE
jgi:hypothetical protein